MTVDDDKQAQYLDFVEFCLADYAIENDEINSKTNDSEINLINKRKWPKNRLVDYEILNDFKKQSKPLYLWSRENFLLLETKEINKYTTNIPFSKFFDRTDENFMNVSGSVRDFNFTQLGLKKKMCVDMKTLRILERNKELNWFYKFNSLYPIKTLGDGNCLCHAILSYLIGLQDINLVLRDTLNIFINSAEYSELLRERWILHRKKADAVNQIQSEDKDLDLEWSEIKSMKTSEKNDQKKVEENFANENNTNSPTEQDSNNKTETKACSSLVYLEDIHIFALANLLLRPIIVLSLETFRNIQPIHLRGIYLPLLRNPSMCIKDPIVIAFHNFHFMPLMFAIDDSREATNSPKKNKNLMIQNGEKFFHFENIDNLLFENLSDGVYQQIYKYEENFKLPKANIKRKLNEFYNILPLIYINNLNEMKVHFLTEKEEKNYMKYIELYLNIVYLETDVDELGLDSSDFKNNKIRILCCHLNKNTQKLKNDGLSIYLDFLNESIKNQKKLNDYIEERRESPERKNDTNYYNLLCKTTRCSNYSLKDRNKYYGYCYDCFNLLISDDKNDNLENNIQTNKTKINEQKEIDSSHKQVSQRIVSETKINPKENSTRSTSIENDKYPYTSSSGKIDKTSKISQPEATTSPKITLCRMDNCKNLVQSSLFNDRSSPYCEKCISKLEATKRETEKMNAKKDIAKSSGIELPVTFETSRLNPKSSNHISAYDSDAMVSDSKLYNLKSIGRTGNYRTENIYEPRKYDELADFSNKYRPSIPLNNSYFNSSTFSGTKAQCLYCSSLYLAKSERNKNICNSCESRFGSRYNGYR